MDIRYAVMSADALIYRLGKHGLEVLLYQREKTPYNGYYALPGAMIREGQSIDEATRHAVSEKAEVLASNIKETRQFKVFDSPTRDPRSKTFSIVSWVFLHRYDNVPGEWFNTNSLPELAFDHEEIIHESLEILKSPTPAKVRGILGDCFASGDYALLLESAGGSIDRTNLSRIIANSLPVAKVGTGASQISGKKSTLWSFKD